MKRFLRTLTAVLVLSSTAASAYTEPRPGAIWIEPIGTVQGAIYKWGYLSLGFEVPGGRGWNWVFGAASVFAGAPGSGAEGYFQFWLSTGPTFFLGGGATHVNGFFITTKLLGTYSRQEHNGAAAGEQGALHLGLDFGYRFTAGPFYLAPIIGVSAGPCFSCGSVPASPPLHVFGNPLGLRGYVELNFNILRIGVAL